MQPQDTGASQILNSVLCLNQVFALNSINALFTLFESYLPQFKKFSKKNPIS